MPSLLAVSLLLSPHARADDAVSLEVVKAGQVGQSAPALVLTPNVDAERLDVDVACGGATANWRGGAPAGKPVRLPLETLPGTHTCTGTLSATFADGSAGDMPLRFQVTMNEPLQVAVDRARLDLSTRTLVVTLDRPAGPVEVTAHRIDGTASTGTTDGRGAAPGTPVEVTWPDGAEVVKLEVKASDTDGFWAGVELFPWYYEIPHEDVVFESGQHTIAAAEEPKLTAAMVEVEKVVAKYGKLAQLKLYVGGYTDRVGSVESNLALSDRRAKAIGAWFQAHGFPGPVLHQGFGERGLAVKTADEQPEAANRRAVYVVAAEPPPVSEQMPGAKWKGL
jgi:outer membrane protein OmpA-like peptidoglycan-associated protein